MCLGCKARDIYHWCSIKSYLTLVSQATLQKIIYRALSTIITWKEKQLFPAIKTQGCRKQRIYSGYVSRWLGAGRSKRWKYLRMVSFNKILTLQVLHQDTWMQCVSKMHNIMNNSLIFCYLQHMQQCIFQSARLKKSQWHLTFENYLISG